MESGNKHGKNSGPIKCVRLKSFKLINSQIGNLVKQMQLKIMEKDSTVVSKNSSTTRTRRCLQCIRNAWQQSDPTKPFYPSDRFPSNIADCTYEEFATAQQLESHLKRAAKKQTKNQKLNRGTKRKFAKIQSQQHPKKTKVTKQVIKQVTKHSNSQTEKSHPSIFSQTQQSTDAKN
jgi:hypothetical protein